MRVMAASAGLSPVGAYLAILLTCGLACIGWALRTLINSLGALRKEQNVQSSGLAVLVERINPVGAELSDHEQRLRQNEDGLAHLRGALENNSQMTQHLISLQLNRTSSG